MNQNGGVPPKDPGIQPKPAGAVKPPEVVAPAPPPPPAPPAPPPPPAEASPQAPAASGTISTRIETYERMVRFNSLARVSFPLLVLSVIVVFLVATWLTIWGAFPDKTVNEQTIRAGEELMPFFNKVLQNFADDVAPEFIDEFEARLAVASDGVMMKLTKDIENLHVTNEQFIKDQATLSIAALREEHKALLLELFPELKDDPVKLEAWAGKVNQAFEHWTVAYMTRVMADYFDIMGQINETVVRDYKAPPSKVGGPERKVVEAEMLELFMELLNAAYDEPAGGAAPAGGQPAPAAEEKPAPAAEEKPAIPEPAAEAPAAETPVEAAPEGVPANQ